ncbi:O-acetyl-ADP-ribose deacetylase [Companilactobacillus sp.]|uniref:O-acetyl-ADP-ribose deacetylase n=1 Tax=Companilactobacillus sp. TaxID=2767905 RepID=UPI00260981D9|nr:O-acetyl-ADP-ribose deacetylase [Companilactobacillus sp.]
MSTLKFEIRDITQVAYDAIVNAANKTLLGGGGVDGAIHAAAGPELLEECKKLNGCETGQAKVTKGYNLPSKYIIHTVGPVYSGSLEDKKQLENCYRNSLLLAKEHDLHRIAFSAISTGVYGYPLAEAAIVALNTTSNFLVDNDDYPMDILLTCYDNKVYDSYSDYIENYHGNNEYLKKLKY